MAWQQPKTNWDTHPKAIEPADMNRIEGNIEVVREQYNLPLRAQIVTSLPSPGIPGRLVFNNSDKRFYFDTGTSWQVQSAPNLGQVIITPTTSNQTIPEGYHNGTGYVKGDPNLVSDNIVNGISIFGVNGRAKRAVTGSYSIKDETKSIQIGFKARCVLCSMDDSSYWAIAGLDQNDEFHAASRTDSFRIISIRDTSFGLISRYESRYYGTYWAFEY